MRKVENEESRFLKKGLSYLGYRVAPLIDQITLPFACCCNYVKRKAATVSASRILLAEYIATRTAGAPERHLHGLPAD